MPYIHDRLTDDDLDSFRREASRRDAVYAPAGKNLTFEQTVEVLVGYRKEMLRLVRKYEVDHDENWSLDATDGSITYEDD